MVNLELTCTHHAPTLLSEKVNSPLLPLESYRFPSNVVKFSPFNLFLWQM